MFFLDCASVMVYGIQCLLVSIFAISLSFLGSGLLRSLGYFFFNRVISFLTFEFFRFFLYSGQRFFTRCILGKCLLSACALSFYALGSVLHRAGSLDFNCSIRFSVLNLMDPIFGVQSKLLLNPPPFRCPYIIFNEF